jgi:ankyrin repeat protein
MVLRHYTLCNEDHSDQENFHEIAKLLIAKGAVVDEVDVEGNTPLHFACEHGHYSLACLLFRTEADVIKANNKRETPLYVACSNGN